MEFWERMFYYKIMKVGIPGVFTILRNDIKRFDNNDGILGENFFILKS